MIYLDNNATTKIDPKVKQVYCSLLDQLLGNPGSMHRPGQHAKQLLIQARRSICEFFSVSPKHLIVTSGATEALTMAILSCPPSSHIITSSLEHAAVREAVLQTSCKVTWLSPESGKGAITADQIEKAITPQTAMVVIMAANNETGALTDLQAIAELAYQHNLLLVVDAVAWIGKETWKTPAGKVAICMSGHKIHAPVGIGCLVYSSGFPLKPLFSGGGQQQGLRGGTESVALTVALAQAFAQLEMVRYNEIRVLRNYFEQQLKNNIPDVLIHCEHEPRVSNVSNVAFSQCEGETLLMKLDLASVAASHGSACQSGALEPSHVLTNMGLSKHIVKRSLRFSLSRMTTKEEINRSVAILRSCLVEE